VVTTIHSQFHALPDGQGVPAERAKALTRLASINHKVCLLRFQNPRPARIKRIDL